MSERLFFHSSPDRVTVEPIAISDQPVDPPSDRSVEERLDQFLELVRRWNSSYSLVSRGDLSHLVDTHLRDSLDLLPYLEQSEKHLDIGTGGGFPGVPIAVSRPDLYVVLNERSSKKCRFLRQVMYELKLRNVEVCHLDLQPDAEPFDRFDTISIRAVAPKQEAWMIAKPLLKPAGSVLFQTGERLQQKDVPGGRIESSTNATRGWISVVVQDGCAP